MTWLKGQIFVENGQTLNVNGLAVNDVLFVARQPPKKSISPIVKQ